MPRSGRAGACRFSRVPVSPLFPFLLLAIGTVGLTVGLHPRFRHVGLTACLAAGLSLLATLALGLRLPSSGTISLWRPQELFPDHPRLLADRISWQFALGLLLMTTAVLVTGLARQGGRRLWIRASILLISLASLGAVFAENLLALAVMWAALDIVYFLALLSHLPRAEASLNRAVVSLSVNSAGTGLVLAASLMIRHAGQSSVLTSPLSAPAAVLLLLASLLRLGLFPPRLGLPDEAVSRKGLSAVLRLGPAAAALTTMSRAASMGFPEAAQPWLMAAGLGAAFFGGFQLWMAEEPGAEIASFVWSTSGLAVMAGAVGGSAAADGVLAFGLLCVLSGAVLFLRSGNEAGRRAGSALPMLAALALAGAPLTIGLSANAILYRGLAVHRAWPILPLVVVAQSMLVSGGLRLALGTADPSAAPDRISRRAHSLGLTLPVLMVVLGGVFPNALASLKGGGSAVRLGLSAPTYWGLGGFALSALLGAALWRFEIDVQARASSAWQSFASLARLTWLYRSLWAIYGWAGRTLLAVAGVLEGEGAALWTLVGALLVWILLRPR